MTNDTSAWVGAMSTADSVRGRSIALLERAREGDREALEALLGQHQHQLRRIVRIQLGSRLRKHVDSMDVVQESLLVASQRIHDFEVLDAGGFSRWLKAIAGNQIKTLGRRYSTYKRDAAREVPYSRRPSSDGGDPAEADWAEGGTWPPDRASRREQEELLDQAVASLPEHYREIILQRDFYGMPWEGVASEVGAPNAHAAMQMHRRARKKLEQLLRPRLGSEG